MWNIFKVFIEFVTISLLIYVMIFFFFFLAERHVGSHIPHQGLNLHSLHWKVKSRSLGYICMPPSFFLSIELLTECDCQQNVP